MANFIEFETEEAYNEAISKAIEEKNQSWITGRLQAAREKAIEETKAQYSDYEQLKADAGKWEETKTGLTQQIADANAAKTKAETELVKMKAAAKHGIPFEMASRLSGTSEEEIEKDAKSMAQYLAPKKSGPLRNPESHSKSSPWDSIVADMKN